jgi:hypothetical protein
VSDHESAYKMKIFEIIAQYDMRLMEIDTKCAHVDASVGVSTSSYWPMKFLTCQFHIPFFFIKRLYIKLIIQLFCGYMGAL